MGDIVGALYQNEDSGLLAEAARRKFVAANDYHHMLLAMPAMHGTEQPRLGCAVPNMEIFSDD